MKNQHTNLASGYRYHGGNALILEQAMQAMGSTATQWCTATQAERSGYVLKDNAQGVQVMLNEKAFTVYNIQHLKSTATPPTPKENAPTKKPDRKQESAKLPTLKHFKEQMPDNAKGWPREARMFFEGMENGGTYVANMGQMRGEFIYCAMVYLAEHGDAQGRRYTLNIEQEAWALYQDYNPRTGKPHKRPEFVSLASIDPTTHEAREELEKLKQEGLAHPRYKMTLTPQAQALAA